MKFVKPLIAFTLCLYAVAVTAAPSAEPIDAQVKSAFAGTWLLTKVFSIRPNGEHVLFNAKNWGEWPNAVLIYSADGWMSVQIAGEKRPLVLSTDPDRLNHPPERGAVIANTYYAYTGRYEVDVATGKVVHFIKQSLHPHEAGLVYERFFKLDGDTLTLTTSPINIEGEKRVNQSIWHRASAVDPTNQPISANKQD